MSCSGGRWAAAISSSSLCVRGRSWSIGSGRLRSRRSNWRRDRRDARGRGSTLAHGGSSGLNQQACRGSTSANHASKGSFGDGSCLFWTTLALEVCGSTANGSRRARKTLSLGNDQQCLKRRNSSSRSHTAHPGILAAIGRHSF